MICLCSHTSCRVEAYLPLTMAVFPSNDGMSSKLISMDVILAKNVNLSASVYIQKTLQYLYAVLAYLTSEVAVLGRTRLLNASFSRCVKDIEYICYLERTAGSQRGSAGVDYRRDAYDAESLQIPRGGSFRSTFLLFSLMWSSHTHAINRSHHFLISKNLTFNTGFHQLICI